MEKNEIMTFPSKFGSDIRGININGEPWLVAVDVCKALDLGNVSRAISRLEEDEKNTLTISKGIPGNPTMAIISEPGFYSLVSVSRKPQAKAFKRWVNHEVLPAIRKTGSYSMMEQPKTPADLLVMQMQQLTTFAQQFADQERRVSAIEGNMQLLEGGVHQAGETAQQASEKAQQVEDDMKAFKHKVDPLNNPDYRTSGEYLNGLGPKAKKYHVNPIQLAHEAKRISTMRGVEIGHKARPRSWTDEYGRQRSGASNTYRKDMLEIAFNNLTKNDQIDMFDEV